MGLKVGDVLRSLYIDGVHAIIEAPTGVPECWIWYLAKQNPQGQFVKFGHARVSAIDPLSWELLQ